MLVKQVLIVAQSEREDNVILSLDHRTSWIRDSREPVPPVPQVVAWLWLQVFPRQNSDLDPQTDGDQLLDRRAFRRLPPILKQGQPNPGVLRSMDGLFLRHKLCQYLSSFP
jgi:hypothetical protein